MRKLFFLAVAGLAASCSSSKYAANFRPTNSNFGYHTVAVQRNASQKVISDLPSEPSLTATESKNLIASSSPDAGIITDHQAARSAVSINQFRESYSKLNNSQKKELKKALTREMKSRATAGVESVTADKKVQMLDHDLRLAAIFGSVGVVGLLIGGNVFYVIGAVALIIGVVFFVMWLTRQ